MCLRLSALFELCYVLAAIDNNQGGTCCWEIVCCFWPIWPLFPAGTSRELMGCWDDETLLHYVSHDSLQHSWRSRERAPVLIPGSPWQQWRWGTARGEGCQSSWMKEEGIGGDTSGNRRGGGLRKEDRRAYQTIFLFSDWVDDMEESGWFLVMAFFIGTALLFTQNRGIWLTFGPLLCSDKLYKCIPPQQTYHTQRGVLELVLLLTADSRVCVKAFVFNGEEVLVVVVTLAKISFGRISDTTEYMNSAACTGQPPVSQSFIWFQQRTELITH